jgi:cell division septation protein DedD
MDWDINIDEDFPADVHKTMPEERTIVPVGTHVATIKKAEEGPNEWKVDEVSNPTGVCLKLRLSIGQHRFVFHDLPKHLPWMAKQLADALGIQPEGNTLRVVPSEIEGREVTVDIVHYTSKAGKVSAVVKRYVPATATPTTATPPKRQTLPQKAHAAFKASAGSDDIPFAWLAALLASVIGGGA